jgi:hypothetical protein
VARRGGRQGGPDRGLVPGVAEVTGGGGRPREVALDAPETAILEPHGLEQRERARLRGRARGIHRALF